MRMSGQRKTGLFRGALYVVFSFLNATQLTALEPFAIVSTKFHFGAFKSSSLKSHNLHKTRNSARLIYKEVLKDMDIQVILDNLSSHKHPKTKSWLARNERFHFHLFIMDKSCRTMVWISTE